MPTGTADDVTIPLPPPDPGLQPGQAFGPYRIEAKLGEGGMGVVYRAVQGTLERQVALKVMRPELASEAGYAERFLREARAAAAVCHQNAVVLFDAGTVEGRLYMAFQFVPGGDCDQLVAKDGPLAPAQALDLIAACCDGLEALHEAGLLHRDIKPHNIFVDAKGRPRLGDFGLARQVEGGDRLTMTGMGMGTPAYMAPEQAQGAKDLDGRADIYALGSTLYFLLTGKAPYAGATPWVVVNAVCNEPPPDPRQVRPDLPDCIAGLVLAAMAKDTAQRFPTPRAFKAAIADCQRLLGGTAATSIPWQPAGEAPALLGPFAGGGWIWPLAQLVGTLLLPLVFHPLLRINPGYLPAGYGDPSWWAQWLGLGALSAVLLLAPLRLRQRTPVARGWCLPALVGGAGIAAALIGLTGQALVACADTAHGWTVLAWLLGIGTGIALIALVARRWSGLDADAILRRAFLHPLQIAIVALVALLIAHLAVANRPQTRTVKEDGLAGILGHRRNEAEWNTEVPRLLDLALPLALCLTAPAIAALRRRRGT